MFSSPDKEADLANLDPRDFKKYSDNHLYVPHKDILRAIRKMSDDDQKVGNLVLGLTSTAADMVAAFEINDATTPFREGIQLWLGVINSNSRLRASRFFGGITEAGRPIVFDKFPAFMHTKHLDVMDKARKAFDLISVRAPEYGERCARMKAKSMTATEAAWIIWKASNDKIIGRHKHKGLEAAWTKLRKGKPANAWTMCLAFGEVVGKGLPITNNPRTDVLNQMHAFVKMVMQNKVAPVESSI